MMLPSGTLNQGDLNLWEYLVLAVLIPWIWIANRRPQPAAAHLRRFRIPGAPRKTWHAVVFITFLTFALRIALIPVLPIPEPVGHDEFSALLQADTFAHGRLTNPTPAMWPHFETVHVLLRPTYQSMYPPALGLILAAGELMGNPWFGVLACAALMCGALTWMLYGYLPPDWAFLGGLLGALRFGVFSYWMNGYWSGAAAALAGALVLGALPRTRRSTVAGSLAGCMGLALLANVRPYEGVLLAIGAVIALALDHRRAERQRRAAWAARAEQAARGPRASRPSVGGVLAGALVLLATIAAMGVYFHAVTGSAFRMPYEVNRATYGWPMTQAWMPPAVPVDALRHQSMRDYYLWERRYHDQFHSPSLFAKELWNRVRKLWSFYLGPLLTLPLLLFGRRAFRAPRLRLLLFPAGLVLAGVLAGQTEMPHYLAPITGAILVFLVQAFRHMRIWRPDIRLGARVEFAILAALVVLLAARTTGHLPMRPSPFSWCCVQQGDAASSNRALIRDQLSHMAGMQLVIVRYGPNHNFFDEWIYNAADLDHAKVIWARELSDPENRSLTAYYHDRSALLLEPDAHPARLMAYARKD